MWFRRDLRLRDNPALMASARGDQVVPVFIFDDRLLHGRHGSGPRTQFMLQCLGDLQAALQAVGADLIVRRGKPAEVLQELAAITGATEVHIAADATPFGRRRDAQVATDLETTGIKLIAHPGLTIMSRLDQLVAASSGRPYTVFSPFHRSWQQLERRPVLLAPTALSIPTSLDLGSLPTLSELGLDDTVSSASTGGETEALKHLDRFLADNVETYGDGQNAMGAASTSRLSAYLHLGAISPRFIEEAVPPGSGGAAFVRQLAWRDFYHYVMWHYPENAHQEFQERYRGMAWNENPDHLAAWQQGRTGYPLVDAGMRQMLAEGFMHNRGRLVVGSFLTKDLGLDWRHGERWFMRWLIDGDQANNNGNWQWIASVGTDPAPAFRRMYNPALQQKRFDPDNAYVLRYVPELARVPVKYLAEPWTMPTEIQIASGCIIGKDYPGPIVDHKSAREEALERYRV